MFSLRSFSYDLRGNYILSLSKPKATTYGLNSFSYFSAKQWNALPDFFRTSFYADFKTKNTGCYLHVDSFCLTYLNLKLGIVNNISFSFFLFFYVLIIFNIISLLLLTMHLMYIYISILFSCSVSSKILAC